jgi:hypothetical protein
MAEKKTAKRGWVARLQTWKEGHRERYARILLEDPPKVSLMSQVPFPGLILIMGMRRWGKTGLAHRIAFEAHEKSGMKAALHLPGVPQRIRVAIQRQLPDWFVVTTNRKEWPTNAVIVYDESSQSAHARRSASGDAVDLDNLISISGQNHQTIIFISHHSRKLDLNVVTEVDRIMWKPPTYAHAMWEREEVSDFSFKAYEFFQRISGDMSKKKATLCLDFRTLQFTWFTNQLAPWWTEELSEMFALIHRMSTKGD